MGVVESVEPVLATSRATSVSWPSVLPAPSSPSAINEMAVQDGRDRRASSSASLLHALNFVIAAFSPNIHALRLNFLEFFGKFYEAGKTEYKPFHKTGGEKSA